LCSTLDILDNLLCLLLFVSYAVTRTLAPVVIVYYAEKIFGLPMVGWVLFSDRDLNIFTWKFH
jgi:hypothetical protein